MKKKKIFYILLAFIIVFGLIYIVKSLSSSYAIDDGTYVVSFYPNNGTWANSVLESDNYSDGKFVVNVTTAGDNASYALTSISELVSRDGYELIGWSRDGKTCETGLVEIGENTSFYACWGLYQITFDANGGTVDGDSSLTMYCAVDSDGKCYINKENVPTATRSGYEFLGWSNDAKTCTTTKITTTKDDTYYACWGKYEVTFDGNGGTPSSQTAYCAEFSDGKCYITAESLPTVTRTGYVFAGWRIYGGNTCETGTLTVTGENKYLACWEEWETFTVTFDSNGGNEQDVTRECKTSDGTCYINKSSIPTATRDGYTFSGWKTSGGTCTTDTITVTGDVTYSACWTNSSDGSSGSSSGDSSSDSNDDSDTPATSGVTSEVTSGTIDNDSDNDSNTGSDMCTYNNYYFFISIDSSNIGYNLQDSSGNYYMQMSNRTHFPALPITDIEKASNAKEICLERKSGDGTCGDWNGETWSLEEFYTAYRSAASSNKTVNYQIYDSTGASDGYSSSKIYTNRSGNIINQYYTHGKWYKGLSDANGNWTYNEEGGRGVDLSTTDVSVMSNASILPTNETGITMSFVNAFQNNKESFDAIITRTIYKDQKGNDSVVPFSDASLNVSNSVLSPALSVVSYTAECPDDAMYNVTIDYYYKGTKDRVKFDNNESNPFTMIATNGATGTITSPTKEGCTPDQDKVSYKVDGQDFKGVVYYTCSSSDIDENVQTGEIFIGAVVVIAIGSLAYVIIYNKKRKKEAV